MTLKPILVTGLMGCGKTSIANILISKFGFTRASMAEWIKQTVKTHYGLVDIDKSMVINDKPMRTILQEVGMYMRDIDPNWHLDEMLNKIISYLGSINKYLEDEEPWKIAKSDLDKTGTILYSALASLRVAAGLLYPVMPFKMNDFLTVLNNGDKAETLLKWSELKSGTKISKIKALFPRFDMKKIS